MKINKSQQLQNMDGKQNNFFEVHKWKLYFQEMWNLYNKEKRDVFS